MGGGMTKVWTDEYRALVRLLVLEHDADGPMDIEVISAARRRGYDADELWRDVSDAVTAASNRDYAGRMREILAIAEESRRRFRKATPPRSP